MQEIDVTTGAPRTKLAILREHMAREEWSTAIRLAATFGALGDEKSALMRAREALNRPEFQISLGRDPAALVEAGKAALRRRYP